MNESSSLVKGIAKIILEHQEQLSKESVIYVVRAHLFSFVGYNTFRHRKLAFAYALKVLMYTSGWCTIDKEEFKDEKWTIVRRWKYD